MPSKLTIGQVRQGFEKEDYSLVSQVYKNSWSKLIYCCPKGHRDKISWNNFQQGARCPRCAGLKPLTTKQVQNAFRVRGFRLLSRYINAHTKMKYVCSRGHNNEICWADFKNGYGCQDCAGNRKLTLIQVQRAFEKEGCVLLSTKYVNSQTPLLYECPKKHRSQIRWSDFQQGCRCSICCEWKNERLLGEILEEIFPGSVKRQDHLDFLKPLRVDYSVRELRLAFEYDGIQHFFPTAFNSKDKPRIEYLFEKQQERDRRKDRLCKENGYRLIRIAYHEELSIESVKKKVLKNRGEIN